MPLQHCALSCSSSSQEDENIDSLIRAVRILLGVEKLQWSSQRSNSVDAVDTPVDHTQHKPVFERQVSTRGLLPVILQVW